MNFENWCKNAFLNWFSSIKKLKKIPTIFDIENWLWKSNFGTFWHLLITPILIIQQFSLGMLIFRQKSFQFCTPLKKTWQPILPYCTVSTGTSVINYQCCILKVVILRIISKNFNMKKKNFWHLDIKTYGKFFYT